MVGRQMMRNHSTKPDPKMVEYYKLQAQEIKRKQQLRQEFGQIAKVIPYVIGTGVGITVGVGCCFCVVGYPIAVWCGDDDQEKE